MKSQFIKESYEELLHKVSWPTWSQLQSSAILVMIASIIFALVVLLMDVSFQYIMNAVYSALYNN